MNDDFEMPATWTQLGCVNRLAKPIDIFTRASIFGEPAVASIL